MFKAPIAAILLAACVVTGCSGERGLACESDERYRDSLSIGPVRVPDDLSPPDESEALRIPPGPFTLDEPETAGETCLEWPPSFFEGGVGGEPPAA